MKLDLTTYGFVSDPFPLVPSASVRNWAGRESVRKELLDLIESVRFDDVGLTEFAVLWGSYGAGKSHALRYLQTLINEDDSGEFSGRAVYISTIRVADRITFHSVYREIITQMGQDYLKMLGEEINNRLQSVIDHLKTELSRQELVELGNEGLNTKAIEQLPSENQNMTTLLSNLGQGDNTAYEYLLGNERSYKKAGYDMPVKTDFDAARILGSLYRTITQEFPDGYYVCNSTYLFLDEVEAASEVKPADAHSFFNAIKEIINQVPYNLGVLISFTGDTALLEAVMTQPLLQRLSREYIELPDMDIEEAKDFLRKQFAEFRPSDFETENPYYPFEEETVEFVLDQTLPMTPRNIFRNMRRVLERAIKRHGLEPGETIGRDIAEQEVA